MGISLEALTSIPSDIFWDQNVNFRLRFAANKFLKNRFIICENKRFSAIINHNFRILNFTSCNIIIDGDVLQF